MMTSEEYERAKKHLNDVYERGKDNLQFMIDAAQQADGNMTKILGVPPPAKTFTESLVTTLFSYALQVAFPAWTVFAKGVFSSSFGIGVFKTNDAADHARVLGIIVESGLHLSKGGGWGWGCRFGAGKRPYRGDKQYDSRFGGGEVRCAEAA